MFIRERRIVVLMIVFMPVNISRAPTSPFRKSSQASALRHSVIGDYCKSATLVPRQL